jgi:polar amino acid transport system permease protein
VSLDTGTDPSQNPPKLFATRRRQLFSGRRGLAASTVSSVVLVAVIVSIFYLAPGAVAFRAYFLNPHDMWQSFVGDPRLGISSIGFGLLTNLWMCALCEVLVLVLGLANAWIRVTKSPVLFPFRVLSTAYTDVFRGVPLLLVFLIVGFGLPAMNIGFLSRQQPVVYGCIALTLTYSAYVAEVFRAGLQSVPNGQILAARSLGLTNSTTMRRVILPQAVRTVVPPLLNDFISLQKDTSLVYLLGIIEATQAAQIYASAVFNGSGYVVAGLLFLALTIPLTRFTDRLIARDRTRRLAAAS